MPLTAPSFSFRPRAAAREPRAKFWARSPAFIAATAATFSARWICEARWGGIFWEYSSRGELVPDEFTVKLWKNYIKGMEMINSFHPNTDILVLDGIPSQQAAGRVAG